VGVDVVERGWCGAEGRYGSRAGGEAGFAKEGGACLVIGGLDVAALLTDGRQDIAGGEAVVENAEAGAQDHDSWVLVCLADGP